MDQDRQRTRLGANDDGSLHRDEPEADVATYTEADCDLGPDDVAAYATVAERMFGQEIVYVEYSGTLGDEGVVQAASEATDQATLFYGGGIHDYDSAYSMAQYADVIVVGNLAPGGSGRSARRLKPLATHNSW